MSPAIFAYLSEELGRRGIKGPERQAVLSKAAPPNSAEPEVLDAYLDRLLEEHAHD